ncbi:DoxX family protein [Paenibacillus sp. D51F]
MGIAELLGVLGLILPQATNIASFLTPLAASGLGAIVLFGAIFQAQAQRIQRNWRKPGFPRAAFICSPRPRSLGILGE